MRNGFALHNPDTAPKASQALLHQAEKALGKVPNLERVMAEAPALLKAYVKTWAIFEETSLSPAERQVVYQVANIQNGCDYCRPWHAYLSSLANMDGEDVVRLRDGGSVGDPRLEALRLFTTSTLKTRGQVDTSALQAFLDAGFTRQQALEVVLGLAIKVMSNYTNALAGTPLDPEVEMWRQ
ncbi:MAG: carboxymuconolactone decarboxylase family protein [Rhodobacteraceae bacterium]|nr:carboxymuconolactone decarboxylase family protein [Paracoccaceae bacterium]